ncbi:hypothetical protein AGOR_G00240660 [Albula goreensis]|uniref:Zonadhesin-like n=1 Tax=Albula goreensis TaxID=1534307 RepID=A0A8T3CJT6_9TELE|nr:hypothetical protein AGOR_G00240660 [Albula goreensis]
MIADYGFVFPEGSYLLREDSQSNLFGVSRLESDLLTLSGVFCLEFWYRTPGSNATDLRVLIKDDAGETEIWTSQPTGVDSWQRAFVPLSHANEANVQVVFEAAIGQPEDGVITIDNVGVRRGPCGEQCPQGVFWADDTCSTQCGCSTPAGPCTYVLAKVCDEQPTVPFFRVEARNELRGDSSTSSIQQVNVDLQGLTMSMLKRETQKVMVNGIWRNLPLSLNSGAVTVSSTGATVILETDFQLTVSYNTVDGVQVKVPDLFASQVCGLCGNFNSLTEDDYSKPDGSRAADAGELGRSWQSEADTCDAAFHPHRCPLSEEAEYESESNCGAILSKYGPFAGCSSIISAEAFFRSCVFNMCATSGDPQALCEAFQTFAGACQSAGITLPPWRNSTFCPLVCQANSHYNECASGCPSACSDQDTPLSCGACEERCDCDPGFLLSGGRCVPAEDCGCWINGQHVEKGVTVMEGDCQKQCQCLGRGTVQCSPVSCGQDKVCRVKEGIVGCFAPRVATCHIFGDPHYLTYDGKLYNFQGSCNYTLTKTCGNSPVQFTVTGRNENRGSPTWSALNSVVLEVQGLHLALRKDKEVFVNGALVQLPADPTAGVKVFLKGPYVQVDTDFGLQLMFDGEHRLFVRVDERYRGEMCGLCGTYSGSQFDDFLTPEGDSVSSVDVFANSWRVKDGDWSCPDITPAPVPCDPQLESEAYEGCKVLLGDVFNACHGFVPVQLYVNSCMYDHCGTLGNARQLCTSLESYVAACELAGVQLGDWRQNTICAQFKPVPTDISTTTPSRGVCPVDCNFDSGACGWQQLITDSFDWQRQQGSTPTDLTGPTHDHTTGTGSYMYIEGDGVYHGDSARMVSPQCQLTGPHCLRFWYHMYGTAHAMALNLYQLQGSRVTKVWAKANNHGNAWNKGEVDINVSGSFQFIIEGIRGSDQRSDVAVDDVSIHYGKCSGSSSVELASTAPPGVTPPSVVGGGGAPHPVCRLDCSFDSDLCSWNQLLTDSFDWMRLSGSTPTQMTGPSFDHTTGAGHYLYIEGDGVYNGDTARLLSSECSDPGPQCLQFWYHIYGTADTMGLTVYLLEGRTTQRLWSRRNDRGDVWHQALVDVRAAGAFQIIFEGRRGTDARSDVALDDVSLHRGTCADFHSSTDHHNYTTPEAPVEPTTSTVASCPVNSHHTDCKPSCEPTCQDLKASRCLTDSPCKPGCVCDEGFVLKWGHCVPVQTCGCFDDDGQKHNFGESWTSSHCTQRCQCNRVQGEGQIDCDDYECEGNEVCHMSEEGEFKCKHSGFSECSIDGDPEYRTFDNMKHEFEGKSSYILVQSRSLPQNLPDVYVEGINKKSHDDDDDDDDDDSDHDSRMVRDDDSDEEDSDEDDHAGRLRGLKIRVYNRTIEFKAKRVLVLDGERVRAPLSPVLGLKILERSSRLYLKTDFGLSVEFDGHSRAEIILPKTYQKMVGGLCGNFDGKKRNDLMKPDGSQAKNVKEFGDSWKVTLGTRTAR